MTTTYDPIARQNFEAVRSREAVERAEAERETYTPIYARRAKKRQGPPVPMIVGGVVTAGVLAAAAFLMMQPRDGLLAEQDATTPAGAAPVTEIAAMPEAKLSATAPPSSAAIAARRRSLVGLPSRWYS